VQVPLAVVFDRMPARHDFARQRRMLAHAGADAEEGRACALPLQQRQHVRGDLRIRAVIDGERDAVGRGAHRQAREIRSQQLAARQQARGTDEKMIA